jgi:thiosulfate/3-mercaptopyruvate sulfurtransferase
MMPSVKKFSDYINKFDLTTSDYIVCYDKHETIYSSTRLWFTFKLFGFKNVYILDGGFNCWKKNNYPTQLYEDTVKHNLTNIDELKITKAEEKLLNFNDLVLTLHSINNKQSNEQIIDMRSRARFLGEVDEPRKFRRLGTIRHSINLYYQNLIDKETNKLKSESKLEEVFQNSNININNPCIFFSGAGISACLGILALDILGKYDNAKLYDGSWAEFVNYNLK